MASGLSVLIHGPAKAGKSTCAATAPAPRLVLDAEAGSEWVPGKKTYWNPLEGPPPAADGTWDTCLVRVRQFRDVELAFQWLASGQHPFNSVILDSVSEIQQRCVDQLVGADQMKTQDWGSLLRIVSSTIRQFRDLKTHPTHPLWAIVYVCETAEKGSVHSKWRPNVQGALQDKLPYIPDICGYMWVDRGESGALTRRLLIGPHPDYEAGERVGGVLGYVIDNPDITVMLQTLIAAQQAYNGS